jgi:hypothetical protein
MTPFAPSPHGPADPSTRVRVKWDNVMIVLIGVVAATFAVVGILMFSHPAAKPAAKDPSTAAAPQVDATTPATDETAPGELSLDDAVSVVEEVRSLMTEGRWDEATDRLELIPTELRDASGATVAQQELEDRRASHDQLRSQLEAAVQARNWTGAQSLLAQLGELAPLDADLTATQELVDQALTPKQPAAAAKTSAASTDASKTTESGVGATKPATTPATKPAATTRPAAATTPAHAAHAVPPATGTTAPPPPGTGSGSKPAKPAAAGTAAAPGTGLGAVAGLDAAQLEALQNQLGAALAG